MKEIKKFRCRIEELPVIAGFLLNSFERDQTDFESFSTDFGTDFIDSYREILGQVKININPANLRAEQKFITGRLYETIESMRPVLQKIEGYVRRAKTLTVNSDNFGISDLRNEISDRNIEGVLFYTRKLLQMLATHSDALSEAGLPADTISTITLLLGSIEDDDLTQQKKVSEHNEVVDINMGFYNQLWKQMNELMDTGKRLYKYEHDYKLDDYTMDKLISKVRRQTSPQVQETTVG